jgi:hypothetical protein
MSIRKPFCAIGLIFYDLKIAVFSTWQAIFLSGQMGKRQAKIFRQEIEIQRQELARS